MGRPFWGRIAAGDGQTGPGSSRQPVVDVVRVLAMFFVMLIHSPVPGDPKDRPAVFFLKGFLGSGAVPLFFMLSGYLAARKIDDRALHAGRYARDRFRTLIVPFLFWNGLVLTLVFLAKALGAESRFRGSGGYFNVEPTLSSMASALLGMGRSPIVYQFWFLRDLIVVSAVSFVICRHIPWIPILLWLLFFIPLPMASSLAYFLLGYSLQSFGLASASLVGRSLGAYCIGWSLLGCGALALGASIPYPLQQIGSTVFILFLALLLCQRPWGRHLAVLGSSTFLIYAMHEPLQTLLVKTWLVRGWPAYGGLFCFVLVPLVVLPLCVLAHRGLRRWSPWLLPYATGGR